MFKLRSHKKELLDGDNIKSDDLYRNLKELHTINSLLGGYRVSLSALPQCVDKQSENTIVDIGCGGGDTLASIYNWGRKHKVKMKLYGIDLKQACIGYSISHLNNPSLTFICDDYKNISNHISDIDIIHAALFCHHLEKEEIVGLIKFAQHQSSILIINDLERTPIAYYAIKMLTAVFSKSYLVKHDAPISVLRGFKKVEWQHMIKLAGAKHYSIKWKWAFRHQVVIYAD